MLTEQKQHLSSLMDGELSRSDVIDDAILQDEHLQHCWHRYHIARDAMRGQLHDCALTLDITDKVAQIIAFDDLPDQPETTFTQTQLPKNLFWFKAKDVFAKVGQVGLAACVTLAIIAGVQYQQVNNVGMDVAPLNTTPIGVNVTPVGGIPAEQATNQHNNDEVLDEAQSNKIRLLIQDYELQKRLNAQ
ncbi:RseA family anti-sigma factor [Orbaceae bacterium ac157xtp]